MGDNVWRIDYQMAPNADPDEVGREDVVRERLVRQFGSLAGAHHVDVHIMTFAFTDAQIADLLVQAGTHPAEPVERGLLADWQPGAEGFGPQSPPGLGCARPAQPRSAV